MAAREGGAPVANPRRDVNADETPELAHRSAAPLSVVGVGASSGGIEPLVALLRCLPVDVDFAVVVITGLNPARASDLAGVLSRATVLPVSIAVDGQRVRPGRVYVMPPDAHLVVEGDVLRFAPGSDWVLAIENKIRHHLANPLHDYIEHIRNRYRQVPECNRHFIVLSIRDERQEDASWKTLTWRTYVD